MEAVSEAIEPPAEMLRRVRMEIGRPFNDEERRLLCGYVVATYGFSETEAECMLKGADET